ncbi:hypothetical protein CIT292_07042 [Citrobacter youngae ATCC 29220]|uniref:Uncharacterized protein n=1 Tax=Citrobacter youngae ATCC 29220 TaxID=500640 RepID=D4B9A2_9ENTR|nr:hypothetical protein CIT292_07042 [Citrobacter youngae ATCC 29220]
MLKAQFSTMVNAKLNSQLPGRKCIFKASFGALSAPFFYPANPIHTIPPSVNGLSNFLTHSQH